MKKNYITKSVEFFALYILPVVGVSFLSVFGVACLCSISIEFTLLMNIVLTISAVFTLTMADILLVCYIQNLVKTIRSLYYERKMKEIVEKGCILYTRDVESFVDYCAFSGISVCGGAFVREGRHRIGQYLYV